MIPKLKLPVARPFLALFDPNHPAYKARYQVYYGGRGSAKSHSIARALVYRGFIKPERILCAREFQNSISDSVLSLLGDVITGMGLDNFYKVQEKAIYGVNGTEFLFKGLRNNIQSVKSTERVTLCWVEEAQTISQKSYQTLIPTIREPGSQIFISFNPDQETDPSYQRFVTNPPPDAHVVKVNYYDNPWFPDELRKEMDYLLRVDPEAHAHVWLGECWSRSDAQVFARKWQVETFEKPTDIVPLFGADWGFSQDPTSLIRCWVHDNKLYVDYELYKVGLEITDTPEAFRRIPLADRYTIRADNARPETISHVAKSGLNIEAVDKWKGSVEDGIAFIRSFEKIIVHERCKNLINELRLYSYKIDRLTGDVLPDLVDKHNHAIDALRYALNPLIQQRGGGFIVI